MFIIRISCFLPVTKVTEKETRGLESKVDRNICKLRNNIKRHKTGDCLELIGF